MPAPYTPLAFANEFIVRAGEHGVEHMKLQKLVYCAYGWWLAVHDDPALDERPEVWRHGPVFALLYKILRTQGSYPVRSLQRAMFNAEPDRVDDGDHEILNLLDWVWDRYRHLSSFDLSDLTHRDGTLWQLTAAEYGYRVPLHTAITVERIRTHYRDLATKDGMIGRHRAARAS